MVDNVAQELKHQQMLLRAVNDTAQILLAAMDEDKFEASVLKGMEIIAHCLDVDRGYIWQNEMRGDVLHYAMIFEWQNDTGRQTNPVENKMVFPYTDIPDWEAKFLKNECVNGPLNDLSQEEKDRLLSHGMKSVFAIPVYLQSTFWGWVSFDDCRRERTLTKDELNILCSVSLMLANAINHNELTLSLRSTALELKAALEDAQSANRAKSEFLAAMSHEIRTPMNAIIGITQIQLQKEDLPQEYITVLEKIFSSSNSLLGIINDILDMSKIETGKMELNPSEYDVPSMVNDAVQLNIVRIGSKPVEFVLDLDENLPLKLYGDELRLKQILNNLLSNAIKYTAKGQVKLSVLHIPYGENVILRFTVRDTGQGIKSEDRERLFSEYLRFNAQANRATEGTGLGLNITKKLVEMMGGAIEVESEYGKGSVFIVTVKQKAVACLPIGAETAQRLRNFTFTGEKQAAQLHITREPMPYGSVLIVDDLETNLYVAEGLLAPYQLNTETASSGFEAIEKAQATMSGGGKPYDIIFMDHMMPEMDGIETTEKLHKMGYKGVIVALTANALTGNDEMFSQRGFDGFIPKPIDVNQLDAALIKFVRDRHPDEAKKCQQKAAMPQAAAAKRNETNVKLLQIFCRDAEKAVATLREAAPYRRDGDIKRFTTTAHAMKSALANVGQPGKSQAAAALEKAGLSDDREFIAAHTESFVQALESLIKELRPAPAAAVEDANVTEDGAYLKEQMQALESACADYDDTAAYAALDRLKEKPWKAQTAAALEKLRDMLFLHSDFDGAAEQAGEMIKNA